MPEGNETVAFGVGSKGKGEIILWLDGKETTVKVKDGLITELTDSTPDLAKPSNRQIAVQGSQELYAALVTHTATLDGAVLARIDPTTGQSRQEVRKDSLYNVVRQGIAVAVGFDGVTMHAMARGFAAGAPKAKRDIVKETATNMFLLVKNAAAMMGGIDQAKQIAFASVKEAVAGDAGVTVDDAALEVLWAEAMGEAVPA